MKRELPNRKALVELGAASRCTKGGPTGYIEVTGFLPKQGIDRE